MKVTLVCLFISLILVNLTLFAPLTDETLSRRLLNDYLPGMPAQLCEKIGIFFDIARLAVVLVVMRGRTDRITLIHRVLAS